MPQSSSSRLRPKDTSRAEARRRYKEEHRAADLEADATASAAVAVEGDATPTGARSAFAMPNVLEDVKALPQILRSRWLWVPFLMLIVAFGLELARQGEALPEGPVSDMAILYIQLTLPPTSLFVFFIGGFLATRASYLVGAILGALDALLITILVMLQQTDLEEAGITEAASDLLPLWGIAILVGILAAAFAAWYKRFLRSSQERAKANRAAREQEQARKAKEQARADKQAAKETRRTR